MANIDATPNKQFLASPLLPILSQHVLINVLNQLKGKDNNYSIKILINLYFLFCFIFQFLIV